MFRWGILLGFLILGLASCASSSSRTPSSQRDSAGAAQDNTKASSLEFSETVEEITVQKPVN